MYSGDASPDHLSNLPIGNHPHSVGLKSLLCFHVVI